MFFHGCLNHQDQLAWWATWLVYKLNLLPFSTDPRSSQSSSGAQAFFGDLENEADIEDGECAHVPGLKKKKWSWGLEFNLYLEGITIERNLIFCTCTVCCSWTLLLMFVFGQFNLEFLVLFKCDLSNWVTWTRVNQSESCYRTKDTSLFLK